MNTRTSPFTILVGVVVVVVVLIFLVALARGDVDLSTENKDCDGTTLVYKDYEGNVTAAIPNSHECGHHG